MQESLSTSTPTDGVHPPALLTVTEFYEQFQPAIGKNRIYELIESRRIKSLRLGERKILIPASELVDWPARELERVS